MPGGAHTLSEEIVGRRAYRLISSRYPTISIFEDLLDPAEFELAYELESMTNDRLRDEVGEIALVPPDERIVGIGSSVVMAAFTHTGIESRFTSGSYGVFYAGLDVETAIAESKSGQARFLSATAEPACEITMRSCVTTVLHPMLDIRGQNYNHLHNPDDWPIAQQFGQEAKDGGESGLWYRSVRNPAGECIAAFKAIAVSPTTQATHYRFVWDGNSITEVFEARDVP